VGLVCNLNKLTTLPKIPKILIKNDNFEIYYDENSLITQHKYLSKIIYN